MSTTTVGYHLMVRVRGPEGLDRLEDLVRDEYAVGRGGADRHVDFEVPEDEFLSRVHCRLVRAGETYAVENLSPNGTRVNGKAITKVTALKHKDRIDVGGITYLELLALSDDERAAELASRAPGAAGAKKKTTAAKPFTKRPIFFGIIAFYGLMMLAVVAAMNQSEPPTAPDPGPGPYFRWVMNAPLRWDADEGHRADVAEKMWDASDERMTPELRERVAADMYDRARLRERIPEALREQLAAEKWKAAMAEHGGEARGRGAHDYYLVRTALEVLSLRGFRTLNAALGVKDPVAVEANDTLNGKDGSPGLEGRLTELYLDATRYGQRGQTRLVRERCEQILAAVPDRYPPIARWAADKLAPPRER